MSMTVEELRALPTEELIRRHDQSAQHTSVGVNYYLEELARRDASTQTTTMLRLTWVVAVLTGVITLLTVVNVIAVVGN